MNVCSDYLKDWLQNVIWFRLISRLTLTHLGFKIESLHISWFNDSLIWKFLFT